MQRAAHLSGAFPLQIVLIAGACFLLTASWPANVAAQAPGTRSSPSVIAAQQQRFRTAYAAYQAGNLPAAATELEHLQQAQPRSFDIHELLGLVYAAQNRDREAIGEFRLAVRLDAKSAAAHDNLATALVRSGDVEGAKAAWRAALAAAPADYPANRDLARLLLLQNDVAAALPLLQAAHAARPDAADNTFDLALAELLTNRTAEARTLVDGLARQKDSGELHNLLGRIDEQEAKYVEAVNEFAAAARLDPSEDNLFTWGSELLLHRAYEPAIVVFAQGTQRFPASPRLWVGLGMAHYSRGEYEPAVSALLTASGLNAADPRCYLFLSRAYLSSPSQADAVIEAFRRYASLEPGNARAQFYYAMSLWKGRRADAEAIDYPQVEALLHRSLALDDTLAETHLQLGILYSDQHQYEQALPQFRRAVALDPSLADAHFRLGRALLRAGDKAASDAELEQFKQLQAKHQAQVDKERAEVQQFVLEKPGPPPVSQQPVRTQPGTTQPGTTQPGTTQP